MTTIFGKMREANYGGVHVVGKWDCGMATTAQTPKGRGAHTSLIYFHHDNDFYSQVAGGCPANTTNTGEGGIQQIQDLWGHTNETNEGPQPELANSLAQCSNYTNAWTNNPAECKYEDELFTERVENIINTHDLSGDPLFLYWAPHIVHTPLQVPKEYWDRMDGINDNNRRAYHAMVSFIDEMIGNITSLLQSRGMWEDTVIFATADNGGPIYNYKAPFSVPGDHAGANNFPLRGGKMHNTEGGIRVNGFVTGGFVPEAVRGTETNALTTGWDFFATSCFLAGVDPADSMAAAAGLPPVDSINLWPYLTGINTTRPRTEVQVGNAYVGDHVVGVSTPAQTVISAIVSDQRDAAGATGTIWKYMVGRVAGNFWMGPQFPNASSTKDVPSNEFVDCGFGGDDPNGPGCLYDLLADPAEYYNLATKRPDIAAQLLSTLQAANTTVFSPNRGSIAPNACAMAQGTYGGFWGPFVGA